jgi:large subunit ribosomal protein L31
MKVGAQAELTPTDGVKVRICITENCQKEAKMAKSDIHPQWYPEAKVFCNGQLVMTVGSTKPELHVDVWSGNHPFFTGTQKIIDTEGRVERFMKKYGMFEEQAPANDSGSTDQ